MKTTKYHIYCKYCFLFFFNLIIWSCGIIVYWFARNFINNIPYYRNKQLWYSAMKIFGSFYGLINIIILIIITSTLTIILLKTDKIFQKNIIVYIMVLLLLIQLYFLFLLYEPMIAVTNMLQVITGSSNVARAEIGRAENRVQLELRRQARRCEKLSTQFGNADYDCLLRI